MNTVAPEQMRVRRVRVTNGLDEPFNDRFNGIPITIAPGATENLPLDMAAHFFGYQPGVDTETMFRHITRRQGWNSPEHVKRNPETQKRLAQELFERLKIEPVMYKMVEAPPEKIDPQKPIPAAVHD